MIEPKISVGIMSAPRIEFSIFNSYQFNESTLTKGDYSAHISNNKINFQGNLYNKILLQANDIQSDSFQLKAVTIGVDFHWERKEDQQFQGCLKLIVENDMITAVNLVTLEDY